MGYRAQRIYEDADETSRVFAVRPEHDDALDDAEPLVEPRGPWRCDCCGQRWPSNEWACGYCGTPAED